MAHAGNAESIHSSNTPELMIVQQRLPLPIRLNNMSWMPEPVLLAKDARHADQDRQRHQTAHDDECEDPLEGDDVCAQLEKCQGCDSGQSKLR